jgi:hypothetical protein
MRSIYFPEGENVIAGGPAAADRTVSKLQSLYRCSGMSFDERIAKLIEIQRGCLPAGRQG